MQRPPNAVSDTLPRAACGRGRHFQSLLAAACISLHVQGGGDGGGAAAAAAIDIETISSELLKVQEEAEREMKAATTLQVWQYDVLIFLFFSIPRPPM